MMAVPLGKLVKNILQVDMHSIPLGLQILWYIWGWCIREANSIKTMTYLILNFS